MGFCETLLDISYTIILLSCITAILIIPKQGGFIAMYILLGASIVYFGYDYGDRRIELPEAVLAVYGENENQIAIQMSSENENQTGEASSILVAENENQIDSSQTRGETSIQVAENENQMVSDNPLHNV